MKPATSAVRWRDVRVHIGWLSIALVAVLAACGSGDNGMIDVGDGRQLYLNCEGEGSPTVVMEAGGAGNSESWGFVQPDVTKFTRVCTYDRAGTGRSSSAPRHTTTQAVATELHALLTAAGVHSPYILVGHSFGGVIVLQFATQYQNEIVGMVMVDSSGTDPRNRIQAALTSEEWQKYSSAGHDDTFEIPEAGDLLPNLADIPLLVLSAGIVGSDVPPDVADKINNVRLEMHRELLDLSTTSTHIIARDSDHAIPRNQPDLIVAAISHVVEVIRDQDG